MGDSQRIVITGMSIITPLGDTVDVNLQKMLAGESAITTWSSVDATNSYCKIGGDLRGRSPRTGISDIAEKLPTEVAQRALRLAKRVPWSSGTSVELALRAALSCEGFFESLNREQTSIIIAGHNINSKFSFDNVREFENDPDYVDPMYILHSLDTDHGGCISEVLQIHGGTSTVGAACASGNLAIRQAIDDLRYHGISRAIVVGAVLDHSPMDLHALGLMGAVSIKSFNENPSAASRPYDIHREGFVPSHGGACLIIETLDSALARGALIYAEVLGAEISSDGSHLPHPSESGQIHALHRLFMQTRFPIEEVDFVSAHATSTPLGDLVELRSIKKVFGNHASKLLLNAPKSILGHTCWSAAIVELVMAIAQMRANTLHPSINIESLDPEADLNIVRSGPLKHEINCILKNSFGFGGVNCVSLVRRYQSN